MVLVSQPTHPAFYSDDVRHHECNVCKVLHISVVVAKRNDTCL